MTKKVKFYAGEDGNAWKADLIRDITNLNYNLISIDQARDALTCEDLEEILDFVCTSTS